METYLGTYRWFVGMLGWADTRMPDWYYTAFGWTVLLCLLLESQEAGGIGWRRRLALVSVVAGVVILLFAAEYAYWNPLRSRALIDGVQGRYLLPIALPLVLSVPPIPKLRLPGTCAPFVGTLGGIVGAAVCLYAVIARYYLV
jgi:hypothetical protein